ncbi:hypothetical protein MATL_G00160660 [Megalops atlanticus]|uniref:THAP-type domain-containing protein n=1 Tax=Megalops atlanticus TaxID=7932 RepID=A0A9D3T265_MEGAT|nr:hypothetical protein MATL_G00160660 [Megalops atlanticus]
MPTSCSAYGCTNVRTKDCGVTFHRFPLNKERRAVWIQHVRRVNFVPSLYTFLCSNHFEPSCFDRTGQTVRLREDAVPTIFNFAGRRHREEPCVQEAVSNQVLTDDGPVPAEESGSRVDVYEDHSYCLLSMAAAKEKICALQRLLEAARKKLKMSQQRERRVALRWAEMRDLVSCLRRKKHLPCGSASDAMESALSSMDLKALRKEMKAQARAAAHQRYYSFQARHFCLTLHFHAPEAYRFVARHLRLPRPSVVKGWADVAEGQLFPQEVFGWLGSYPLQDRKLHLRVNGGTIGADPSWDSPDEDGTEPEDSGPCQALAFLLVAVNGNMKLPFGYALCSGLSASDLKDLILRCLLKLHNFGVTICEVMFDELSTNIINSKMPKEELYTMLFDFFISHRTKSHAE